MNRPRELARQLTHPLALLLWAAALLSFIVGSITVGVAVVLIIAINAAVAIVQERHAENAVEALAGYIRQKLTVVRHGTRSVIDTAELVPGNIALVEEGERIAADMRLIPGAVEVDLSTLTGESVPAMRSAEYHVAALGRGVQQPLPAVGDRRRARDRRRVRVRPTVSGAARHRRPTRTRHAAADPVPVHRLGRRRTPQVGDPESVLGARGGRHTSTPA